MYPRLVCFLLFSPLLLLLSGCGPSTVTRTVRTVEQTAIVPTPDGPHAMGRIPASGEVLLEGGYSAGAVLPTGKSRYEGASGNIYTNHSLRGRVSFGVGPGDIGLDFDYTNVSWSIPTANDLHQNDVSRTHVVRGGPQFRGIFVGDRALGFGGLLEFSLGNVPYQRVVYEKRSQKPYMPETDSEWWNLPDSKFEMIGSRVGVQQGDPLLFFARAGLFGTIELTEGLTVLPGVLLQNTPDFWGAQTGTETCLTGGSTEYKCSGYDPTDRRPFADAALMTLFTAISWEIGPLLVTGQLYGHPVASNFDIVRQAPLGGDLVVGVTF